MMLDETKDNFARQQYGNDDAPEPWRDRFGFVDGHLKNVEPYLRYRKLNYRGYLLRGISWRSGENFAELRSTAPYSQLQNEGAKGGGGTGAWRYPPSSTKPLRLGGNPVKRQFMGVGERTKRKVFYFYDLQVKKLL